MTERCFYRISIKALIRNDDKSKFLLALEQNGRREFPGGGLDHGEDPIVGLHRELEEELGVKATSIQLNPSYFITTVNLKEQQIANVFYETTLENLDFTPSDECIELRFVTAQEALDLNLLPNVRTFAGLLIKQRGS